jgi:hypothetical protein
LEADFSMRFLRDGVPAVLPRPHGHGLRWLAIAMLLPLVGLACSASKPASNRPQTHPAKGRVTMGGQPLGGATVTFRPDGAGSGCAGITDESGNFKLSTFAAGDGAVPGKYGVTVTKVDAGPASVDVNSPGYAPPAANAPPPKSLLPDTYADPAKSGLTAEVAGGKANVFEFDIKR